MPTLQSAKITPILLTIRTLSKDHTQSTNSSKNPLSRLFTPKSTQVLNTPSYQLSWLPEECRKPPEECHWWRSISSDTSGEIVNFSIHFLAFFLPTKICRRYFLLPQPSLASGQCPVLVGPFSPTKKIVLDWLLCSTNWEGKAAIVFWTMTNFLFSWIYFFYSPDCYLSCWLVFFGLGCVFIFCELLQWRWRVSRLITWKIFFLKVLSRYLKATSCLG